MKIDNTLLDKMLVDTNLMQAYQRVVRNGGSQELMECNIINLRTIFKNIQRNQGTNKKSKIQTTTGKKS